MVHFILYEDILQYKVKTNQVINKLNSVNYKIHDETYKLDYKKDDIYIYIIDLEKENTTEYISNVFIQNIIIKL